VVVDVNELINAVASVVLLALARHICRVAIVQAPFGA
jgi:hypothetical protein